MDSVTQAVLGAAMGQAVLGKSLGSKRALLWGAFAGTIPDLDVLSRLFLSNEIYGLIYHRGLTHSIFFTVLFSPLFGWLALRYYQLGWHKRLGMQLLWASGLLLLYAGIATAFVAIALFTRHWLTIILAVGAVAGLYPVLRSLIGNVKNRRDFEAKASWQQWSLMFFLAILTHWLIDACTSYGTQIFEPFSSYRISFDNISIIDPLYTVPLLLGCGLAVWLGSHRARSIANWAGIVLSTAYMALSFVRKDMVHGVAVRNLQEKGIAYHQIMTSPTLGNTLLWNVMVEAPDSFYFGMYSIRDREPRIAFTLLPKNHHLLDPYRQNELVDILVWFAQDYYNITPNDDGSIQFNNLRFGIMDPSIGKQKDPYFVKYTKSGRGKEVEVRPAPRRLDEVDMAELFALFWKRMYGNQ